MLTSAASKNIFLSLGLAGVGVGLTITVFGIVYVRRRSTFSITGQPDRVERVTEFRLWTIWPIFLSMLVISTGIVSGIRYATIRNYPVVTLRYPHPGMDASRENGFIASGHASDLGAGRYFIWIVDHPSAHLYIADQQAIMQGDSWQALDAPLGFSKGPHVRKLGYKLTILAVLADHRCDEILGSLNTVSKDRLSALPTGCRVFGQTWVRVNRP